MNFESRVFLPTLFSEFKIRSFEASQAIMQAIDTLSLLHFLTFHDFSSKQKQTDDVTPIVSPSIVRIQNMSQSEIIMTQNMSAVVMCEGQIIDQSEASIQVT